MKVIKNNKLIFILVFICIVMLTTIGVFAISLIPKGEDGKYGNRLDGINNHVIEDAKVEEMKTKIKEQENVKEVTYNLNGRLVNIIINVEDVLGIEKAKEYANMTLQFFEEDKLSYYDVQVFLTSDNNESQVYPLIGYKHKTSTSLVWKQ